MSKPISISPCADPTVSKTPISVASTVAGVPAVFAIDCGSGIAATFAGEARVNGNLEVNGNIEISGNLDGSARTTISCFDVTLVGADCAEEFDVADPEANPGTVVVIANEEGALRPCDKEYERTVAGVISGAGDFRPGIVLDRQKDPHSHRLSLALVGKVYCKVDAQYAPIDVGDLLTTSPTKGHAMKAIDPTRCFGSVIGKALRPLTSGRALVPILVALQ
jgi:hypothetical protein